jgi:regulation of enolase protein 1 (concanavalin A-like superfamily)
MPLYYDNSDPAKKYYSEAVRTWKEPQNWTIYGADTLRVCFRGGALGFEETAPGTVTMSAAGADIYGTADEFTFASKSLNGNGSITVRVDSVENSHVWAKAGVMIRESLYADARHAIAYVTPDGRVGWEYRQLTAGTTENTRSNPGAVTLPHWIRLTRDGDTITAAHSSDGVTWSPIVDADNPTEPSFLQFPMTASVFVGLALTSHAAGVTCTAEFSGIAVAGASGAWQFTEIGVDHMLNDRADLYVTIRDANGRTKTARYPDGTIIDEWTEWDIPFTTLTGAGVNMAAVSTMAIGVGDPKNPKAGGVGTLFIDDIGFGRDTD